MFVGYNRYSCNLLINNIGLKYYIGCNRTNLHIQYNFCCNHYNNLYIPITINCYILIKNKKILNEKNIYLHFHKP